MKTQNSLIYNLKLESTCESFKTKSFVASFYGEEILLHFIYDNKNIYIINTINQSLHVVKKNTYYLIKNHAIIIKEINLDKNLLRIGIIL
jgi:hypothetical protein